MNKIVEIEPGVLHWPQYFDLKSAAALAGEVSLLCEKAGWIKPVMANGRPFSVRQMNLGRFGWISDRSGYRYEETHPATGEPWPAMPGQLLDLWRALFPDAQPPECCLVNHYTAGAKMGLHQDADEEDPSAPVLSVSLGDEALFRVGGLTRKGRTRSFRLLHGDVMALSGPARMRYHGIDRVYPDTGPALATPGRLNLTLRRVTKAV